MDEQSRSPHASKVTQTTTTTLKLPGLAGTLESPKLLEVQVARLPLGFGVTVSTVAHLLLVDGVPEMVVDLVERYVSDEDAASYRFA